MPVLREYDDNDELLHLCMEQVSQGYICTQSSKNQSQQAHATSQLEYLSALTACHRPEERALAALDLSSRPMPNACHLPAAGLLIMKSFSIFAEQQAGWPQLKSNTLQDLLFLKGLGKYVCKFSCCARRLGIPPFADL